MPPATRDRILDTSAELFRRQGFAGTGLQKIVAGARAPLGSIYHFFPGGKEELGEQVIRRSGELYGELVDLFYGAGAEPVAATVAFFAGAADTLVETDYADACPIATIALEVASTSEPMRQACADVFAGWIDRAAIHLAAAGLPADAATQAATGVFCLLEGAFVLARAQRSTAPVAAAGAIARDVVAAAVRAV